MTHEFDSISTCQENYFSGMKPRYSLHIRPHIPAHTNLLPHESHHKACTCLSSYWTNEEMSADGMQIRPLRHSSFSAAKQFFNSCTWA